jgi:large conductance mechanosensitive channel
VFAGFKKFLMRGNVLDLAVALVIGAAFTQVVKSLVDDIITPLITAIVGKPSYGDLKFKLHNSVFTYGNLVNAVINFLAVAAAVYFVIVVPINKLAERRRKILGLTQQVAEPVETERILLAEIRDLLAAQRGPEAR